MHKYKKYLIISLILLFTACHSVKQRANGYIEGDLTYISSPVAGQLIQLAVSRGQLVTQQQLLFTLIAQPEQAQLQEALQTLSQAQAQQHLNALTLQRQQELLKRNVVQKQTVDEAQAEYLVSTAQVAANQAAVERMRWTSEQKRVVSPKDGFVFDTFYVKGEQVNAYQPVLALLAAKDIRIIFFISEKLLAETKIGQAVQISCDGCQQTSATINYISPQAEYTPPVIYSRESREQLVYRVEAALPENIALQFHPGQPVDIGW